jgi:hypothetical protein
MTLISLGGLDKSLSRFYDEPQRKIGNPAQESFISGNTGNYINVLSNLIFFND